MEQQFTSGQRIRLNDQGTRYYAQIPGDERQNLIGTVTYSNAHVTYVRPDKGGRPLTVYTNCIALVPSDDDVAEAIESITQTPRRGQ